VRTLAAAVVGELRLSEHAPLLRDCLEGDDDLATRAARGLGLIGDGEAVPALVALLADPGRGPSVRVAAATALGAIGDPRAALVLGWQLRSQDWSVRAAAEAALPFLPDAGRALVSAR